MATIIHKVKFDAEIVFFLLLKQWTIDRECHLGMVFRWEGV